MQLDPHDVYERLVTLGEAWADAHAAAELLEETKKTVLAHLMNECNEKSSSAKETFALSHEAYKKHIEGMVNAKKVANRAKVKFDSAKVWAELLRTKNANERAVLRNAP